MRNLKQAGFELRKYLKDFDFSSIRLPEMLNRDTLCSCKVFDDSENLILYGRPGTGKTHLATALGIEACNRGLKVLYYRTSRLVNVVSQDAEKMFSFLKKLDKADVLILDEWGYIPFETGPQPARTTAHQTALTAGSGLRRQHRTAGRDQHPVDG